MPQDAPADDELEPQTFYGRIQIPSIEVDSPLLEGIRINTLDYGPGHWPGTAMPGELGNVVVAGHRTSHNADFRRLDELKPGDEVIFDLDASDGFQRADGVEVTVPTPDDLLRPLRLRRPLGGDRHAGFDVGGQPGLPPRGDAVRLPPAGVGLRAHRRLPRPRRS